MTLIARGGHVLAAQQHVDAIIAALLSSRSQPAETAALQQYLNDAHAGARTAVSAVNGTAESPAAAILTLTAYGQRFARDVRPALESLAL